MPGFVGCELIRIALPLSLIDSLGRIRMRGDGRRGSEEIKVLMLEIKLSILISTRPVYFAPQKFRERPTKLLGMLTRRETKKRLLAS